MIAAPFHAGERALQQSMGSAARLAEIGPRVVRDFMPEQHRDFFAQLPFVVVGGLDADGAAWASLRVGAPGFAQSPDAQTLVIDAAAPAGDPIATPVGASLGLLGIESPTRRRNRMNGRVVEAGAGGLRLAVEQSFGNCPKYIATHAPAFVRDPALQTARERLDFDALDAAAQALVRSADTLFVASHAHGGSDVSHRGGRPGFVKLEDARTLLVPDFEGNRFYMTLGNLLADGRAGLLFIGRDSGDLLLLSGRAEVVDGDAVRALAGAERGWRFHLRAGRRLVDALPLRWRDGEPSPVSLATGTWPQP